MKINDLEPVAKELNEASDELNKVYTKINEELKKLNLGIKCEIQIKNTGWIIGYYKLDNKWGLCVSDGTQEWHINDSPRYIRYHAVDALPELILSLKPATTAAIKKMKRATERANEILKGLTNEN